MPSRPDPPKDPLNIPVLDTARLRLRPHAAGDFEFVAAMWSDPDVVRFIADGKPLSRADSWNKFQRFPGHWHWTGFGSWAIEDRASGRLIGEVGFIDRNLPVEHEFAGVPEVGWALAPVAFGKGYATEAVNAALDWGRGHFGRARVLAVVQPENVASLRVAQKCGFRELRRGEFSGRSQIYLDRLL